MKFGARLLDMGDMGFGHPRDVLGYVGGRLMAWGNADTERHLVALANLGSGEAVLVLGPSPGVGLQEAALRSGTVVGSTRLR